MRLSCLIIAVSITACGDREPKPSAASQAVAAAENKRRPPGEAELSVSCYPNLNHLKRGDQLFCTHVARWTGEPPLLRDDPYYKAKMTFVSGDSSIVGNQFPGNPPVAATDSSPRKPATPPFGPLTALKVGKTTLTVTVHDKTVTLPVVVEDFPNVTVRWEPVSETTLYVGQTLRTRVLARDSLGAIVTEVPRFAGSSSFGVGVVRVDTSADRRRYTFTALAPGRFSISASLLGRTAGLVLTVKDTPAVKPSKP